MKRTGFTLIEMLIVIVLMAIGLIGVSGMYVAATVSNVKTTRLNFASYRAEKEMERIRSGGFSGAIVDPTLFSSSDGYTIITQTAQKTGVIGFTIPELPGATGRISIAFYQGPTGIYPNLKQIKVWISWSGSRRAQGQVTLVSYLGNRP